MADWLDSLTDNVGKLVEKGANAYSTIKGASNTSSEEEAYLRGQLTTLAAVNQQEYDRDILKIGDAEISTSSVVWIIGGTLGMIAIVLGLKKLAK